MSFDAAHESNPRRACDACRDRQARCGAPREADAEGGKVVCFDCYRAARNGRLAPLASELETIPFLRPTGPMPELTVRAIAHRRRMLSHLGATGTLVAGQQR